MHLGGSTRRIVACAVLLAFASLGPVAGCKKSPPAASGEKASGDGEEAGKENADGEGKSGKPGDLGKDLGAELAKGDPKPAGEDSADSWVPFESKDGKFSARFPSAPESQTLPTPTVLGNVDQKMFSSTQGMAFYAASYADYPGDAMATAVPAEVLDGARDGAVQNVQGKLISEEKISVKGHPGRSIRIEAQPEGIAVVVQAQIYLVKNRLYQMIVVRPGGLGSEDDVTKFFASFKLAE